MIREKTVCYNIKSSWHAISRMYSNMGSDYGVSTSTGFVLLSIDPVKGTPATKIGPSIGLENRSLTRVLKALEEKKWICRKPDAKDGRKVRIFLTELGKEKRNIARKYVKEFNKQIYGQIPEEKMSVFLEVIDQIQKLTEHSITQR